MGLSEQIRQQLIDSFKTEQQEHIQKINAGLLALEKNPPTAVEQQAILKEIFREAHSLKGAARAVGFTSIESLGHALESLLLSAKEGRLSFAPELFDLLYQTLDAIEIVMTQVEAGTSTPPAKVVALLARLEEITTEAETKGRGDEEARGSEGAGEPESEEEMEIEMTTFQPFGFVEPKAPYGQDKPSTPPFFHHSNHSSPNGGHSSLWSARSAQLRLPLQLSMAIA